MDIMEAYKKGVIDGEFYNGSYASAMDRMYAYLYNQNYYGQLYSKDLLFYKREELNKRREEIGLHKFKK